MQKRNLRYKTSKIVYIAFLEISLIVDVIFALSTYEVVREWLGNSELLAVVAFLMASILGTALYLIYIWQMEYLTKHDSS